MTTPSGLGGDPNRIFLMGHSAGAHIASLLTLDPEYLRAVGLDRGNIRGFAGLSGPYDFKIGPELRPAFGMPPTTAPVNPDVEPINFVDGREPPMLLLQGGNDHTVDPGNTSRLAEKVRAGRRASAGNRLSRQIARGSCAGVCATLPLDRAGAPRLRRFFPLALIAAAWQNPSAMWIKRIVLLAIIASFPNRSDADSAPVEGVDLGVSSVTIQPIVPDAKLKRDLLPVVSSCVNPSSYARAVEGHCRGVAGVVGCLPILYPNDFLFTAASFTRTGTTLNLTLSYHPSGGTFVSPSGRNLIVFAAPLPTDLPDGHYHLMCNVVRDAADGATPTTALAEAELECDLDLPDPAIARSEKDVQSLAAMGDAELLQAYETRGHALKQTQIGPMDDGIICQSAAAYEDDRYYSWQLARAAVLHRGGSMVPLMMEMLRREVPRNHDLQDGLYGFGFARDLMEMLSAIGDPRPVPLLVDVLVGFDGNANPLLRTVAAKALRHLTFISFARHEEGDEYDCVIAPTTELDAGWNVDQPWAIQRHSEAAGYRHWLANEGKNPPDWLPLAQGRARTILAGDNFAEISAAIRFLQGPPAAGMGSSGHDNDPAATMTRLGQIMAEAKSQRKSPTGPATCTWKNQEIELPLEQLANFGPRARPLMPMLLRVAFRARRHLGSARRSEPDRRWKHGWPN